jgi:hypothetical protein
MIDMQLMKREEKWIERNNWFWNEEMFDLTFEVSDVPQPVKKDSIKFIFFNFHCLFLEWSSISPRSTHQKHLN